MIVVRTEDESFERLERPNNRGIGFALRTVLEVLYEAGEPLTFEEIAVRTQDRVGSAVRNHAYRAWLRDLRLHRAQYDNGRIKLSGQGAVEHAWRPYLNRLVRQSAYRGVLIRDGSTYRPNPDKAAVVYDADGKRLRFTRDQWQILSAAERAAAEVSILPMHVRNVIPTDPDALDDLLEAAPKYWRGRTVRLDRSTRQLFDIASTDEARAWLLRELVRRRYPKEIWTP